MTIKSLKSTPIITHIHKQGPKIAAGLSSQSPEILILGSTDVGFYGGIRLSHPRVGHRIYLLNGKQFPKTKTLKAAREYAKVTYNVEAPKTALALAA